VVLRAVLEVVSLLRAVLEVVSLLRAVLEVLVSADGWPLLWGAESTSESIDIFKWLTGKREGANG
jgi:hypothetical protein